ncbi:hypothetical protein ACPA54_23935 [Uniformispora flossi]|uniref:hypothetical protein n=1 Tax=Uniformispora flossi TaxID=3390723 RepID=UPI003C2F2500
MHTRRTARTRAAVLAGLLGIAGAVVAVAPAAQAAEVDWTSSCTNDFMGPVGDTPTKVDISVSPVKDTYTVGDRVSVTWKWLAYNKVPLNSPISVPADSTKPTGDIQLSGAQSDVFALEGPQKNPLAAPGEELKVQDMTGTLTLTAPGTLTLTPKGYRTITDAGIAKSTTTCLPAAGQVPGVAATLTVEGQQTADPVISGPAESHRGWEIELTGGNFVPNATPQLSMCAADGSDCNPERFTANTLAIDGQGKLTGKATLTGIPTQFRDGAYAVKVSDGVKSATYPIAITTYVAPGPREATATPDVGAVGDVVNVRGSGWVAVGNVTVVAMDADGLPVGSTISAFTDAWGNFSTPFTITDPATTQIRVREGISSVKRVFIPFTLRTVPPLSQNASVTLNAGALAMTQAGDGLDFGTVTMNGEAQTVKANLNQVTVVDARGGNLGWSLTGSMTDLVAANGTDKIPAGNLAWTPSCGAGAGSLSAVANGTAGPLSSSASTLCSVIADGKTSGGKFTADAEVALTTPKFGAAGSYTGTLTLTLI